MKIVIDILTEDFEEIQFMHSILGDCFESYKQRIMTAIYHGTPLPKGHGRLIDADTLYDHIIEKYSEGEQLAIDVTDAPTIIEADKEVEDDRQGN